MAKQSKTGYYIEVGCPGCGGDLHIDDDLFVISCGHCGSVLRLVMPPAPPAYLANGRKEERELKFSMDRFLKEKRLPLSDSNLTIKAFYYPFWKIDGLLMRVRNRVERRVVQPAGTEGESEVSFEQEKTEVSVSPYTCNMSATEMLEGIPDSVGMRADVVKLHPFAKEKIAGDFDVIPVTRPWNLIQQRLEKSVSAIGEIEAAAFGKNVTELFHPRFKLVYFPFYAAECYTHGYRRFMLDGITGRLLHYKDNDGNSYCADQAVGVTAQNDGGDDLFRDLPQIELGRVGIEFHRCTTCGVDLPDQKSYFYICPNCHEPKTLDKTPLPLGSVSRVTGSNGHQSRMFPFWVMQVGEYDRTRIGRLFGGIYRSDRIVLPAFKIAKFESLYRLTERMSPAWKQLESEYIENFDNTYEPVEVGLSEAIAMAEVAIYRKEMKQTAGTRGLMPKKEGFFPEGAELLYVPFHAENYFFVDSVMQMITFEKRLAD